MSHQSSNQTFLSHIVHNILGSVPFYFVVLSSLSYTTYVVHAHPKHTHPKEYYEVLHLLVELINIRHINSPEQLRKANISTGTLSISKEKLQSKRLSSKPVHKISSTPRRYSCCICIPGGSVSRRIFIIFTSEPRNPPTLTLITCTHNV